VTVLYQELRIVTAWLALWVCSEEADPLSQESTDAPFRQVFMREPLGSRAPICVAGQ
jgi:hypothetical protein